MKTTQVRDVVKVVGGGTPKKSVGEYYNGNIPWVTPKDMKQAVVESSAVTLTQMGVENSPAKEVPAGSVLVVVRSGVLKHTLPVARTTRSVTINQDMKALIPRATLDSAYLARLLKSLQPLILSWVRATTADNFPIEKLLDLKIDLPPLDEQQRVATILEHADALQERRRRVLSSFDRLAHSIFHEMAGEIHTNPREWAVASVSDVAELVTDGEHKTPRRSSSGVPLLSARNVRDGWIDFDNTDFVDEDVFASLSRRIAPRTGDVLISCSGSIGRVARVREQARFAMVRSAALVRPGPLIQPSFLEYMLSSPPLTAAMVSKANSSAQANLFQNQIRSLPMLLPPLDLQQEFDRRLAVLDVQRASTRRAAAADDELFASLQARAFRGEL